MKMNVYCKFTASIITLMLGAVRTSETSVYFTRAHVAISQKIVIFLPAYISNDELFHTQKKFGQSRVILCGSKFLSGIEGKSIRTGCAKMRFGLRSGLSVSR
jgi:hypothetical protein